MRYAGGRIRLIQHEQKVLLLKIDGQTTYAAENDSPRTSTTTETIKAQNKDLISPLPCIMSDHSANDLRRDIMPKPPKEMLISTKKEKESRLFEVVGRVDEGRGGVARVAC